MRRMYQSKMYQVNGTSALASYKPAFKVIEGGANVIGKELGVDQVISDVLPSQKESYIRQFQDLPDHRHQSHLPSHV